MWANVASKPLDQMSSGKYFHAHLDIDCTYFPTQASMIVSDPEMALLVLSVWKRRTWKEEQQNSEWITQSHRQKNSPSRLNNCGLIGQSPKHLSAHLNVKMLDGPLFHSTKPGLPKKMTAKWKQNPSLYVYYFILYTVGNVGKPACFYSAYTFMGSEFFTHCPFNSTPGTHTTILVAVVLLAVI